MSKEVALKKENEIVMANFDGFEDFAGEGFGDTNASDFVIPRLGLIGQLSPQIKRGNAKFIEGAEVGDIADVSLNSILAKGYDGEGVHLLPVMRIKEVIEWKPRTAGGGMVSRTPLTTTIDDFASKAGAVQNDKFEWKIPNGNELIETWNLFCIDIDRFMPVFVPFKKSNLKMIKPWFTQRNQSKFPRGHAQAGRSLPLLFRTVKLSSFEDSGNGNEWANWKIEDGVSLPELGEDGLDLKQAAADLLHILKEGSYKAEIDNDDVEAEFR